MAKLRARFGGHLARPVFVLRANVDVRAVRDEDFDDFRMVAGGRPHQRGLAAEGFNGIDVCVLARSAAPRLSARRRWRRA